MGAPEKYLTTNNHVLKNRYLAERMNGKYMHYRGGNHEMHTYSGEFKENTYFNRLDQNVGEEVSDVKYMK